MQTQLTPLEERARDALKPAREGHLSPAERIALYKRYLTTEEHRIQLLHVAGGSGLEIAGERAALIDTLIGSIFEASLHARKDAAMLPMSLVATGGYGRRTLNPSSDIDLLFLLPHPSTELPEPLRELVQEILYLLWDVGFKVGHACRSIDECLDQAQLDQENKTSLMDARLITGDADLFAKFQTRFDKECLRKGQLEFFEIRRNDLRNRHKKYSHTVFLQEPNVKESCGALRDYHNILWVARVKLGTTDLAELVEKEIMTASTRDEIEAAHDFLHRVRNELHYHNKKATDQLTLQLQGVVSTAFRYPQKDILRQTEAFMRDYYTHTRHLYRHTTSLMETFQIEQDQRAESGFRSFLTFRQKNREEFDGFIARDGRLFPSFQEIFTEDPTRLMRLFQHCQQRNLKLSPELRRLVAAHWETIDKPFRYAKTNRLIFQSILERKGEVARILRLMHRIGVLGRYLPEFGALDCLVQHEFFHRYTADEHTLRCVDQLDQLITETDPRREIYRRLFLDIQDAYALYLACILHDTGRAENVREHIDGSAMLASRLCNRLQIQGERRTLIMFLVDNHLSFWRTATTRNLDDPEVIGEFAKIVKTPTNLDALFLFTFVDSNATSPDGWTGWKESLMLQLHNATSNFLEGGKEEYSRKLDAARLTLRDEVLNTMRDDYQPDVERHFDQMPAAAFHFRQASHIVTQVRTVRHFLQQEAEHADPLAFCIKWIDHTDKGYTELVLATRDKPLLLEKVCCALASEQVNILSADLFTRQDGVVVNIFRVCTTNFEPVATASTRKRFLETFEAILKAEHYEPEKFLRRKVNFLKPRSDTDIHVPVRAYVTNSLHPTCTTVEIQGLDRIGLLHDLFHTINRHGLTTAHARICTEKGVAMDTLYITTSGGLKIEDPAILTALEVEFSKLIARPDTPG